LKVCRFRLVLGQEFLLQLKEECEWYASAHLGLRDHKIGESGMAGQLLIRTVGCGRWRIGDIVYKEPIVRVGEFGWCGMRDFGKND